MIVGEGNSHTVCMKILEGKSFVCFHGFMKTTEDLRRSIHIAE